MTGAIILAVVGGVSILLLLTTLVFSGKNESASELTEWGRTLFYTGLWVAAMIACALISGAWKR